MPPSLCIVREAVWPQDLRVATALLRRYQAHLLDNPSGAAPIHIDGYETELAELDRRWGAPNGVLLLAEETETAIGCAAVRLLPDRPQSAELKRMWVNPDARGHGAGRALILAAVAWALQHGAHELLLDTVPGAMPAANRLYVELGFEPSSRYNENAVEDIVFYRKRLHAVTV